MRGGKNYHSGANAFLGSQATWKKAHTMRVNS
jgi:hypothetical protein